MTTFWKSSFEVDGETKCVCVLGADLSEAQRNSEREAALKWPEGAPHQRLATWKFSPEPSWYLRYLGPLHQRREACCQAWLALLASFHPLWTVIALGVAFAAVPAFAIWRARRRTAALWASSLKSPEDVIPNKAPATTHVSHRAGSQHLPKWEDSKS